MSPVLVDRGTGRPRSIQEGRKCPLYLAVVILYKWFKPLLPKE